MTTQSLHWNPSSHNDHKLVNFNVPTNGFKLNDEYHPVTNEEYEIRENESKRRIRLISKNLIDQFVKEFQNLITP